MLFKIPIKIDDPEEIDWAYFWEKKVEDKESKEKMTTKHIKYHFPHQST